MSAILSGTKKFFKSKFNTKINKKIKWQILTLIKINAHTAKNCRDTEINDIFIFQSLTRESKLIKPRYFPLPLKKWL